MSARVNWNRRSPVWKLAAVLAGICGGGLAASLGHGAALGFMLVQVVVPLVFYLAGFERTWRLALFANVPALVVFALILATHSGGLKLEWALILIALTLVPIGLLEFLKEMFRGF